MKNAKLTVIVFNDNDVIATSGAITVTWTGFYDNIVGNATLHYGELEFFGTSGKGLADFNAATGLSCTDKTLFKNINTTTSSTRNNLSFKAALNGSSGAADNGTVNDSSAEAFNGTFTWQPTSVGGSFVRYIN